jgi:hypothetical protein
MASFGSSCHGNGKRYSKIVGRFQTGHFVEEFHQKKTAYKSNII